MVSQMPNPVKRAENIRRAFERAAAENVHVEPMGGEPLQTRFYLAQSSQDRAVWYTVTMGQDADAGYAESCTCPAGERGLACKHQAAAELHYRAENARQVRARVAGFAHQLTPDARRWAGLVA